MHDLDDLAGRFDVAVAVNSLVMPDVRDDRPDAAGDPRGACGPAASFLGVVPSMDAIHYHTMLLMDRALDRGLAPEEAERHAAFHAEHRYYEFAFGRFVFQGLRQKFWQPFEIQSPPDQGRVLPRSSSTRSSTPGTTASPAAPSSPIIPGAGTGRSRRGPDPHRTAPHRTASGEAAMTPPQARAVDQGPQEAPLRRRADARHAHRRGPQSRSPPTCGHAPEPLSAGVKAALWGIGLVVGLLLAAAAWKASQGKPRPAKPAPRRGRRHRRRGSRDRSGSGNPSCRRASRR